METKTEKPTEIRNRDTQRQSWGAGTDTETELGEGRAIELSWKS